VLVHSTVHAVIANLKLLRCVCRRRRVQLSRSRSPQDPAGSGMIALQVRRGTEQAQDHTTRSRRRTKTCEPPTWTCIASSLAVKLFELLFFF
jgi:hypothetical protein